MTQAIVSKLRRLLPPSALADHRPPPPGRPVPFDLLPATNMALGVRAAGAQEPGAEDRGELKGTMCRRRCRGQR